MPNHFSSIPKAGANLAARALWCLAGQCVRPTPACAADAGYDFSAATETDLSVAGFDVTGVACAAEDDVGTVVVTACGADGEEYAVAGCRCAAEAPEVPAPTCDGVVCRSECRQLRVRSMEPPDCCACVTGDTLGLRDMGDAWSECKWCGTVGWVILGCVIIGASTAVLGSEGTG